MHHHYPIPCWLLTFIDKLLYKNYFLTHKIMNDSLFTEFLFTILKVIFSDTSTSGIVMKNIPIRIAPSHIEPVIYIFL